MGVGTNRKRDRMIEGDKTIHEAGGAPQGVANQSTLLGVIRKQLESLRQVMLTGATIATAALAFLVIQALITSKDVAIVGRDLGLVGGELDSLKADVANIRDTVGDLTVIREEIAEVNALLKTTPEPPARDGSSSVPLAPRDWTGVYLSELSPLLPYLAQSEAEIGKVWIYSDNEAFVMRINEALRALKDAGMEIEIERSE